MTTDDYVGAHTRQIIRAMRMLHAAHNAGANPLTSMFPLTSDVKLIDVMEKGMGIIRWTGYSSQFTLTERGKKLYRQYLIAL